MSVITLDPDIWGPHFWFFFHTIARMYPLHPNEISKKKYYEFICNIPLFIPNDAISKHFCEILTKFPVSPYLDNRESLMTWFHMVHNYINEKLNKPKLTMEDANAKYEAHYAKKSTKEILAKPEWKKYAMYGVAVCVGMGFVWYACAR